jgi:hypothetical protein
MKRRELQLLVIAIALVAAFAWCAWEFIEGVWAVLTRAGWAQ